ncbi:MAG: hypothetical protein IKQ91_05965 [Oscillospiraceae bacterium]|nr:hypothetical protein [Oscillospiraceae bacterium]
MKNKFLEKVHTVLVCFAILNFIFAIIDGLYSYSQSAIMIAVMLRIATICINGLMFLLLARILEELLNMIYNLQEVVDCKEDKKNNFNQAEIQQKYDEELEQYSDSIFFKE